MRQLMILLVMLLSVQTIFGQDNLDKYFEFLYGTKSNELSNYKTKLITDDLLNVSPQRPIIIKTPNPKKTFNVYAFNKIFENNKYYAVLIGAEHPFKPKLITYDHNDIQISELLLISHFGVIDPTSDVTEEVRIASPTDITLITISHIWILNEKGERIKNSKKITKTVDKYIITENGTIEKNEN
jgi:hypothetical protein